MMMMMLMIIMMMMLSETSAPKQIMMILGINILMMLMMMFSRWNICPQPNAEYVFLAALCLCYNPIHPLRHETHPRKYFVSKAQKSEIKKNLGSWNSYLCCIFDTLFPHTYVVKYLYALVYQLSYSMLYLLKYMLFDDQLYQSHHLVSIPAGLKVSLKISILKTIKNLRGNHFSIRQP